MIQMTFVCILSIFTFFSLLLNEFFLLFYLVPDPNGILRWLADQLQSAEDADQKAYIVGHVPPASHDVMVHWNYAFNDLTLRFKDTVSLAFSICHSTCTYILINVFSVFSRLLHSFMDIPIW